MPFFEGKQELYHLLCFLIMPVTVCTLFYFLKPRKLWLSPIIIMCLFFIVSAIFYPYIFTDVLTREYDLTTIYWFIFVVPAQILLALLFTAITYFTVKLKTRRR